MDHTHAFGTRTRLRFRHSAIPALLLGLALMLFIDAKAQFPKGIEVEKQEITLKVENGQALKGSMWTVLRDQRPLGKVYDSRRRFANLPGQFDPENNEGENPVLPFETLEDAVQWLVADYNSQLQQNMDSLLMLTDTAWITRTDSMLHLRYSVPAAWMISGQFSLPDLTSLTDSIVDELQNAKGARPPGSGYNTLSFVHRHHDDMMLMMYVLPLTQVMTLDQATEAVSTGSKLLGARTLRTEVLTISGRQWSKLHLMGYSGKQPAYITLHEGRLYLVQGGAYNTRSSQAAIDAMARHVVETLKLL